MRNRQRPADGAVLAVFVKAPLAGRVKTRLALGVGPARAAQLYRRLGRKTLAAVAGVCPTVVWYGPWHGGRAVRAWLYGLNIARFRPQVAGDLGKRLATALAVHFREGAGQVVVIGSDCPGVTPALIQEALGTLERRDIVLGPAHDGGYYLIGMNAPHAALFEQIQWSSADVCSSTIQAARELGLSHGLLPVLRDVDTAADARALGLLRDGVALETSAVQHARSQRTLPVGADTTRQ